MFNRKSAIWLCVFVLTSVSQIASAQSYYPNNNYPANNGYNNSGYNGYNNYPQPSYNNYPQQNNNNYYNQQQPAYSYAQPAYPQNYYPAPGYPQNYYPTPGYNNGYGYNNNGNGFNRMFKGNKFGGGGRNFGEELWPGRGSIYEDALPMHGPWDRNWGRAPWNRDYENMWGPKGGPDKWFDFNDPKEGVANAWEDMLYTPNALGTMPGGWKAPSISVPNPVDVGDEFKDAARDMPDEMKNFSDGFTYGEDGYNNNPNKGQFGVGNNKKKKGINIEPKTR